MDNSVLRKRLSTYKSGNGTLRQVGDDVVLDVLKAWENWPGSAADLYRDLGLSKMQMVTMIQKAKRLVKSGVVPPNEFKEIKVEPAASLASSKCGIEIAWDKGKIIRFSQVDQLIDFLKKVA